MMRDWTAEATAVWRHVARNCGLDPDDPAMVQALTAFAAEVARATRAEAAQAALDESADPPPGGTPWAWGYAAGRLDAAAAIEEGGASLADPLASRARVAAASETEATLIANAPVVIANLVAADLVRQTMAGMDPDLMNRVCQGLASRLADWLANDQAARGRGPLAGASAAALRLAEATCAWEDAEVAGPGPAAVSARYAELLAARDAYRASRKED